MQPAKNTVARTRHIILDKRPADAELGGELVEVESVPRLQSAREDAVAQLVGRLGPDGGADQFDI